MSRRIGLYPRVRLEGGGSGVVSQAGVVLLVETVRKSGLTVRYRRRRRRGASRGRCTTRARSCWTSRSESLWAGTASPMSPCCAPSPTCSARGIRPDGLRSRPRPRRSRAEDAHRDPHGASRSARAGPGVGRCGGRRQRDRGEVPKEAWTPAYEAGGTPTPPTTCLSPLFDATSRHLATNQARLLRLPALTPTAAVATETATVTAGLPVARLSPGRPGSRALGQSHPACPAMAAAQSCAGYTAGVPDTCAEQSDEAGNARARMLQR